MKREKRKFSLKLFVFLMIISLIFWLIPAGMISADDSEQGNDTTGTTVTESSESLPSEEEGLSEETAETTEQTEETSDETVGETPEEDPEAVFSASLNVVSQSDTVKPEEAVILKIIVKNTGNSTLTDVNVTYSLPDLVIFDPVEDLNFNPETRKVSYDISAIDVNAESIKEISIGIPAVANDQLRLPNKVVISSSDIEVLEKTLNLTVVLEESNTEDAQEALIVEEGTGEEQGEETGDTSAEESTAQDYSPFIYSDKDDYFSGEEVTIYGEGFVPGEEIQIIFYAITGDVEKVEYLSRIDNVDENGDFIYKYKILGADRYRVEARTVVENESGQTEFLKTDATEFEVQEGALDSVILGILLAWTEFTDPPAPSPEISYSAFEGETGPAGPPYTESWTTGDIKNYFDGDKVRFRIQLTSETATDSGDFAFSFTTYSSPNRFFKYQLPTDVQIIGSGATAGAPFGLTSSGDDAIAKIPITFTSATTVYLMFTLQFADTASSSGTGSSQHVRVENLLTGDFKWSGNKAIPIPADAVAPRVGSITLTKNFVGGDTTATFYLKGQDGSYYLQDGTVAANKAAAAVTFSTNGQSKTWSDVPWQNYYLEEDPISGYTTDNNPATAILIDGTNPTQSVIITNTQQAGSITINKSGLNGSDTAKFTLTGGPAGYTIDPAFVILDNDTTDATYPATYTWTGLPYGTYTVTESWSGNTYTYTTSLGTDLAEDVVVDGAETLNVVNTQQAGSITINKSGLNGSDTAKFTLTGGPAGYTIDPAFVILDNDTTDATYPATYTWTGLPYGTYTVTESWSGNTYTYTTSLGTDLAEDVVVDGAETLNVVNTQQAGSITINKSGLNGSDTAKFTLTGGPAGYTIDPAFVILDNDTTDATYPATYTWTGLPYGTYTVTESWSGNTYTYTTSLGTDLAEDVVVDGAETLNVVNTQQAGSITINKSGLNGSDTAKFTLTGGPAGYTIDPAFVILDNDTTDATYPATYTWTGLPYGTYTVTESWSGNTYTYTTSLGTDLAEDVVVDGAETLNVVNTQQAGSITINKSGLNGSDTAKFTLTGGPAGYTIDPAFVILDNDTTDATYPATYTWTGLPYGTYTVTESWSGNTYTYTTSLGTDLAEDVVVDGAETLNVVNTQQAGSITINKSGLNGSDTAKFTLTGGPAGYTIDPAFVILDNDTTDATYPATYTWTGLPYGTYTVTESWSGNTYTYTTSLGTDLAEDVVVDGAETLNVVNTQQAGSITINKSGLNGSDTAKFTLTGGPAGYTIDPAFVILDNDTTDATYPATYTWTGLPYGTYTVTESWSGNTYTYTTSLGTDLAEDVVVDGAETLNVVNTQQAGSITINKSGLNGSDTAKFTLTGGPAGYTIDPAFVILDNDTTDATYPATYTWTGLPYGTYTVTESWSGNTYTYTTSLGTDLAEDVVVDGAETLNVVNTREKGTINLIKYLNGEMPPTGTTSFTINWTGSDGSSGSIVLDEGNGWSYDGSSEGFDIYTGVDYTFTEDTSGGFIFEKVVGNDSIEYSGPGFTFTAITGENGSIAFYNATASIIVHKTDSETGEDVEGAEYTLYMDNAGTIIAKDAWGNDVEPQLTDSDGTLTFTGLLLDIYYVKETDAPSGYDIDDIYHQVIVDSDSIGESNEVVIEVEDDPISSPPPPPPPPPPVTPPTTPTLAVAGIEVLGLAFTGVDPIFPIAGIGTVIGGLGLLITSLIRRKKKNTDL